MCSCKNNNNTQIDTFEDGVYSLVLSNLIEGSHKINNLEKEYFKQCYEYIGKDTLQIPYDMACNDLSRLNFISFDENIYFNQTSKKLYNKKVLERGGTNVLK